MNDRVLVIQHHVIQHHVTSPPNACAILNEAAGRPGHIFNLRHGIISQTPVDNVKVFIAVVHDYRVTSPSSVEASRV